jgi:hypothetical protein
MPFYTLETFLTFIPIRKGNHKRIEKRDGMKYNG